MELMNLPTGPITMSSREIAELTGKRHDNVMRVCRDLKASGVCPQIEETPFTLEATGQTYTEFRLDKRDSLVLVARLSPEFTAKVVDRWMELESETPRDIMKALGDNAWLRGALLTYTEKVMALEAENKELGVKADALDRISTADGSLNITEAAKALQVQPKSLFQYLQSHGWIYKRPGAAHYLGYQTKVASGLLEHKVGTVLRADGSEKITEQVRVTPKGLAALSKLFPPPAIEIAA